MPAIFEPLRDRIARLIRPAVANFNENCIQKRDAHLNRIHIIGRKNSGKTTLIVDLVHHFTSHGYRVATIKHTHHHHELDTPGKDSHRHRQAGATAVGILSPTMNAVFWPQDYGHDAADRYDQFAPLFADCDLVLVEGHSQVEGHKVEVWRSAASSTPMASSDNTILAVVTDDLLELPVPTWSRSDVPGIAKRILDLLDRGSSRAP